MAGPRENLAELRKKESREALKIFHGHQDGADRWLRSPF